MKSDNSFFKWLELKIPPPAVFLILILAIRLFLKQPPSSSVDVNFSLICCLVIWAVASLIAGRALWLFFRQNTTIHPEDPDKTRVLIVDDVYRISRNPMYLSLSLLLLGYCLWVNNLWCIISFPVFILYINRFQIKPEERILLNKFGDKYKEFCKNSPRWIWKF